MTKKYLIRSFSNLNHPLTDNLNILWVISKEKKPYKIFDIFTLLAAFHKTKEFKTQIRRAYYHPLFEFPYSDHIFSPQINMEIGFLVQNSSDPPTLFKELTEAQFRDFLFFYTDGSKSQDGKTAGCASVCPSAQLRHSWKLNSAASIFSIEAIAVLYTLDHIKEQKFKNSIIFTDSLSVLQSISSPNPNNIKSCLIFVIRNRLAILSSQNCNVILAWIPGHVGIPGNELADATAKSASMNAPFLNIELPHSDFSRCFREYLDKRCHDYCSTRGKHFGAYYTQRFYKPSRKPWFANFNARREWIVTLCRMRSNHHSLRESLHRKNIVDSPGCPCDPQIKEDLEHVLWECPRFDHFRPGLLKGLSKALKCNPPFQSKQFLTNPSIRIVSHVFRFLKKAKLQI